MTTLTTPVELLQHDEEFAALLDLYRDHQPKWVLEVGTWQGGTLYHWLTNATPGALVVTVDTSHQHPDRYPQWARAGVTVVTLRGRSQDADIVDTVTKWAPYDFVFIDADHHDAAVRADWATYSRLTRSGGIVALHDITPTDDPTIQVAPLWAELVDQHKTLELTAVGGYGIGVVFMPEDARS